MDDDEDDMHICLVCQVTICGLVNYIHHKKNDCRGKKVAPPPLLMPSKTAGLSTVDQTYFLQTAKSNDAEIFTPVNSKSTLDLHIEPKREKLAPLPSVDYGILGPHGDDVDDEEDDSVESQIDKAWQTLESSINSDDEPDNDIQATHSQSIATAGFSQDLFCSANGESQTSYTNSDLSTALNLSPNFPTMNIAHSSQSHAGIPSTFSLSTDKSPIPSTSVNINEIMPRTQVTEKEPEAQYPSASEKVDDFFLSLELRSRAKAQKLEKNPPELPISNILNNLTFSSDDEDLGFNFADDVSLDGFSDDSAGSDITAPPSSHTGGKWRPGEAPKLTHGRTGRPPTRGKWPPGEAPTKKSHGYKRRPKGGKWKPGMHKGKGKSKSTATPSTKDYVCNICNVTFANRFAYSCHCGSQVHKENVFGKDRSGGGARTGGDDLGLDESRSWRGKGKGKSIRMYKPSAPPPEDIYGGDTEDDEPQSQHSEDPRPQKDDAQSQPVVNKPQTQADYRQSDTGEPQLQQVDKPMSVEAQLQQSDEPLQDDASDSDVSSVKLDEAQIVSKSSESQSGMVTNSEAKTDIVANSSESQVNDAERTDITDVSEDEPSPDMHSDELPAIHVCAVCDKKYHNKYVFARHLLTKFHQNRSIGQTDTISSLEKYHKYIVRLSPYQCGICRFYFNTNGAFQQHLQSDRHFSNCETLAGKICCSLCKFKCITNEELIRHTETEDHVARIRKCYKICIVKESHVECRCKYCGLSMKSFSRLKHHIQIKHADGKIVKGIVKKKVGIVNKPKCPYCERQCPSYSAMNIHVRRRHTHEKPYRCEMCNTAFADRYALDSHFKTSKHLLTTIEYQQKEEQDIKQGILTKLNLKKKQVENNQQRKSNENDNCIVADKIIKVEKSENYNVDMNFAAKRIGSGVDGTSRNPHAAEYSSNQSAKNVGANVEVEPVNRVENMDMAFLTSLNDSGIAVDSRDVQTENDPDDEEWLPAESNSWSFKDKKGKWQRHVSKPNMKKGRNKSFKCDHCSFVADKYSNLRPHYLKEHSSKIKLCEACDMVFLSHKALSLHVLSNVHQRNLNKSAGTSTEVLHQCPVCKKKFTDEKYCQFHTAFKHHHLNTEDCILQEFKGKDLTRQKYGHVLAEVEHLENRADVKCPDCPNTVKKSGFIEHLRIHCGDTPFKCKLCPKSFISSVTLRRHLLGHFACQDNTCSVCGKDFKKLSTFQLHMNRHRKEESGQLKDYVCDVCGQSFFTSNTLAMHRRRHGEKTFACPYDGCFWRFVFQAELKHHLMSHTKERPYLCDKCGYGTTTKSRLKRHSITHSGERKHHCEYCTYKAGNATHLRRHMRIHIGSKPYICPYCNYSCNTHENMRKHISETKKHDGLKVYPCRFCEFGTNTSKDFRQHLLQCHVDKRGSIGSLTELTGLYHKELDPKKPLEGTKIIQAKERAPRTSKQGQSHKKMKSNDTTELETAIAFFSENESDNRPDNSNKIFNIDSRMKSTGNEHRKSKKSINGTENPIIPNVGKIPESKPDNYSDVSPTSIPYSDGSKFVAHESIDVHINYPQLTESANHKSMRNIGPVPPMALMIPVHEMSSREQDSLKTSLFQPHGIVDDPRRDISTSLLHALQAPVGQDIAIDHLPRTVIPNQNFAAHQFQKTSFTDTLHHSQSKYDSSRGHMYPSNQGRPISHAHSVGNRHNSDFQIPVSDVVFPGNSRAHEQGGSIYNRYAETRRHRNMPSDMDSENLVIDMSYIENA